MRLGFCRATKWLPRNAEDSERETLALESGKALIADVFLGDRDKED